jgi:hypothetical protein
MLGMIGFSDDLRVSLTTSKFSRPSEEQDLKDHNEFVALNLPICVTENYLGMVITPLMREKVELVIAESLKKMAKTIYVDAAKNYIFVGEDPEIEETGLIVYSVANPGNYEKEFFRRFQEVHSLLMEYQVLDQENKHIVSLKSMWVKSKWQFLDWIPIAKLSILEGR